MKNIGFPDHTIYSNCFFKWSRLQVTSIFFLNAAGCSYGEKRGISWISTINYERRLTTSTLSAFRRKEPRARRRRGRPYQPVDLTFISRQTSRCVFIALSLNRINRRRRRDSSQLLTNLIYKLAISNLYACHREPEARRLRRRGGTAKSESESQANYFALPQTVVCAPVALKVRQFSGTQVNY